MSLKENTPLVQITEKALSMPRAKNVSTATKIGYRLTSLGKSLFGSERLLRFYLNSSRVLWRFAFEISGELYDASFHNNTKALSADFLLEQIPENGSVIDIGCGLGRWCRVAADKADKVFGIDYDKTLIDEANKRTEAKNVTFLVGDVTKDLNNERFDLALLLHVIEHIDDADKILQDLHKVASKLIVEVPDFEQDPLNYVRLKQGVPFYSDGDHVLEYTQEILIDQLERNGWKVSEIRKNGGAVLAVAELAS